MSGCIVAAQTVMVAMAFLVGRKADVLGTKAPLSRRIRSAVLAGSSLPLSDDRYWLFGVQSLDGIGAGLFGALFPLIIADLTRGTGHFNLAQGAVLTAQGIGAALSTSLAGFIVAQAGYSVAFLSSAVIAAAGLLLFLFGMGETGPLAKHGSDKIATAAHLT